MIQIVCATCQIEFGRVEDAHEAEAVLVSGHAAHCPPHHFILLVDGQPIGNVNLWERVETHAIRFVCQFDGCQRPKDTTYRVPKYLIGAVAIAWHSDHEAHAFETWLDGRRIHPPQERAA